MSGIFAFSCTKIFRFKVPLAVLGKIEFSAVMAGGEAILTYGETSDDAAGNSAFPKPILPSEHAAKSAFI